MSETVNEKRKKSIGGISTPSFVIPIAIILVILHIGIIVSIIRINSASEEVTGLIDQYDVYIREVGEMQASSSILSETSTSFLLNPVEAGVTTVGPLIGYVDEYGKNRSGQQVSQKFSGYDVSENAKQSVRTAMANTSRMIEIQTHAIALTTAVYPLPNIPALQNLPKYDLSDEEIALSNEEKLGRAYKLITGMEYATAKRDVSNNLSDASTALREEENAKTHEQIQIVELARTLLWITTITTIIVLLFVFFFAFQQLVAPLGGFVRSIDSSSAIDARTGFYEVRLLAKSYNELLERKTSLEAFLRTAAETDALTDLPNRYFFEQCMSQTGEKGFPVALILFDVNFLKTTNDREGHLAGDALLKRAAYCINQCFGTLPESKCFRYGGDEFAAIVKSCSLRSISDALAKFNDMQDENNVSIATGYAFTEDIGQTTYHALFSRADKEMYVQKNIIHGAKSIKKS